MIVRFELTMPNVGSYNGVDTGSKSGCYIFKNLPKSVANDLNGKSFHYDFGDGWAANVKCSLAKRSKTKGFRGYNWMVDEILKHGKILTRFERKKFNEI